MRFYTVKEVAVITGRSVPTIYNWIDMGFLKAVKVGSETSKGAVLIPESALQEFLEKNLLWKGEITELKNKILLKEVISGIVSLPDEKAGRVFKILVKVGLIK
ncbi:MAG: helix-turn-helix domain-containing protein [Desulfurobacteriaceae bacterium]